MIQIIKHILMLDKEINDFIYEAIHTYLGLCEKVIASPT